MFRLLPPKDPLHHQPPRRVRHLLNRPLPKPLRLLPLLPARRAILHRPLQTRLPARRRQQIQILLHRHLQQIPRPGKHRNQLPRQTHRRQQARRLRLTHRPQQARRPPRTRLRFLAHRRQQARHPRLMHRLHRARRPPRAQRRCRTRRRPRVQLRPTRRRTPARLRIRLLPRLRLNQRQLQTIRLHLPRKL